MGWRVGGGGALAVRVGSGAVALEDADVRVGGAWELVHEDVDGLSFGEGCGVLTSDGGHVSGGVGGVERAVAFVAALGPAEG